MSGAEVIAVLGVISSVIAIVDGIAKVCDATKSATGLPQEIRDVAGRLPLIRTILEAVQHLIESEEVDEQSCKAVKHVIEACKEKAKKLDDLCRKVIPKDGASGIQRQLSAVKTLGKGDKAETLMKGMLVDIQLLAIRHRLKVGSETVQAQLLKDISKAIEDLMRSKEFAEGSLEQNCLMALFLSDPREDRSSLESLKGSRVRGTCEWILETPLYKSWLLGSDSALLWLSGGPGKGKTMLSIFITKELERTANQASNILLLQYYCDNKDEKRNTGVSILRGLLWQLLKQCKDLFVHILPSLRDRETSQLTNSFESLWRIFETMLRDHNLETVYCVLDGLDECEESSSKVLVNKLKSMTTLGNNTVTNFKLMVVSREHPPYLSRALSDVPRIRLDPDANSEVNGDIQRFVELKVNELTDWNYYPEQLRTKVKAILQENAQGTFLWVALVAKALENYQPTEYIEILKQFPPGLDEMYARILLQIKPDRRELAAKILLWVVMAVRPLTLSELGTAVEIPVPTSVTFSLAQTTRDQIMYCGSFLVVGESADARVRLVHQSAKDYLLRKPLDTSPELETFRVSEEAGHCELARKCLKYLESAPFFKYDTVDYMERINVRTAYLAASPLIRYAALHWPDHAKVLVDARDHFDLSRPFFRNKSSARTSWLQGSFQHTALAYAIEGGHEAVVRTLLREPQGLIAGRGGGRTIRLLGLAFAKLGFQQSLRGKRAYIEARNTGGETALLLAARCGSESMVQFLLNKGADFMAKDSEGRTVLIIAAERYPESTGVVRLLLDKDLCVNERTYAGHAAIDWAAMSGNCDIIRLLVDRGANIEGRNKYGGTALHCAAKGWVDQTRSIVLRLQSGADIKAEDMEGMRAIRSAAQYRSEASIRVLVEHGADIEARNTNCSTALHEAAYYARECTTIRLLLDKGLDLEAKDKDGCTPLLLAVHSRTTIYTTDRIQLLLERGANIEARDNYGRTALLCGFKPHYTDTEDTMKLLLVSGARVEAKDFEGRTALIMSVTWLMKENERFGKWSSVEPRIVATALAKLLLAYGADVKAMDNYGRSALSYATEVGCCEMVQLLIGASIGSSID